MLIPSFSRSTHSPSERKRMKESERKRKREKNMTNASDFPFHCFPIINFAARVWIPTECNTRKQRRNGTREKNRTEKKFDLCWSDFAVFSPFSLLSIQRVFVRKVSSTISFFCTHTHTHNKGKHMGNWTLSVRVSEKMSQTVRTTREWQVYKHVTGVLRRIKPLACANMLARELNLYFCPNASAQPEIYLLCWMPLCCWSR